MIYTCYVTGCRTGYKPKRGEASNQNKKIALYKFPTDTILKEKWIKAIL